MRFGSTASFYGMTCLGSSLSVLDYIHMGSCVSLRSYARLGSGLSFYGCTILASNLSVLDHFSCGSALRSRAKARAVANVAASSSPHLSCA